MNTRTDRKVLLWISAANMIRILISHLFFIASRVGSEVPPNDQGYPAPILSSDIRTAIFLAFRSSLTLSSAKKSERSNQVLIFNRLEIIGVWTSGEYGNKYHGIACIFLKLAGLEAQLGAPLGWRLSC